MVLTTEIFAVLPWVSPAIFWAGAAATSIPIIIHLLNKRRFRIVIWAAMDWLLAAQKRNARKLKFQRWLLLALRCLAIIVLSAAIAQMFLSCSENKVLSAVIGGHKISVIILDDSYSMGYGRDGQATTFDRAKKLAADYLNTLSPGDRAMVIRTSEISAAVGGKLSDPKVWKPQENVVSDAGTDLANAISTAADIVKSEMRGSLSRQVIVLTDLSKSSLPADSAQGDQANRQAPLKAAIAKLRDLPASFTVVDLGSDDQSNTGVTDLRMVDPIAVVNSPVKIEAKILNASGQTVTGAQVTLLIDGRPAPASGLPKIEPGREIVHSMDAVFASPGPHTVEVQIPRDLCPTDDVRRMIVDVQRDIPMLIVEGRPSDGNTWSSTWPIQTYVASTMGRIALTVVTDSQVGSVPLNKQKIILFSDAAAPSVDTAKVLDEFVRDGGLLIVFPGDQTRGSASAWHERLGSKGLNLLPSDFGQLQDLRSEKFPDGVGLDPLGYKHPSLAPFGEAIKRGSFIAIETNPAKRYYQLAVPADSAMDVIMRFKQRDGTMGGDPAIVSKQIGRGRVVQFAMGMGGDWSGFTTGAGSFPQFFDLLLNNELAGGADRFTMLVGQEVDLSPDVTTPGWWVAPRNTRISVVREPKHAPKDAAPTTAPAATAPGAKPPERLYATAPLTLAGFYGPEGSSPVVAVNPDGAEANIIHVAAQEMADAMGIKVEQIIKPAGTVGASLAVAEEQSKGASIARELMFLALALFVTETICARLFSVYR